MNNDEDVDYNDNDNEVEVDDDDDIEDAYFWHINPLTNFCYPKLNMKILPNIWRPINLPLLHLSP